MYGFKTCFKVENMKNKNYSKILNNYDPKYRNINYKRNLTVRVKVIKSVLFILGGTCYKCLPFIVQT